MTYSNELICEFKTVYSKKFNENISDADASLMLRDMVQMLRIIYNPRKEQDE